jgi:hypothetical protein
MAIYDQKCKLSNRTNRQISLALLLHQNRTTERKAASAADQAPWLRSYQEYRTKSGGKKGKDFLIAALLNFAEYFIKNLVKLVNLSPDLGRSILYVSLLPLLESESEIE